MVKDRIWAKEFCCFWPDTMELTAANQAWPITDTDSVLCVLEDCASLQSLWNSTIVPPWQSRLQRLRKFTYLLAGKYWHMFCGEKSGVIQKATILLTIYLFIMNVVQKYT